MRPKAVARLMLAVVVAGMLAAAAFTFRFNPLGGTLAGFDNDHFVHLLRTDMLLHGEQPLRDFAESELRGAVPSLGYQMSAWAQQAWGRTLLAEAYLTVGLLALAAGAVFLFAFHLTGRLPISLLVASCVIVAHPKLYNYEKVLILLVGILLVRLWVLRPSWPRLAALSAWTAVAALFRHDFAVYVGIAAGAAFLVHGPASISTRLVRIAAYGGLVVLLLAPSIAWVQKHAGLVTYAQRTAEAVTAESSRTRLGRPRLDLRTGFSSENLITLTYYAFWILPACGLAVLALLFARHASPPAMAMGCALLACTVVVNLFFLRGNLLARFGDAIVAAVLLGAWTTTAAGALRKAVGRSPVPVRGGAFVPYAAAAFTVVPGAVMFFMLVAMFAAGDMRIELQASGLSESWEQTQKRFRAAHAALRESPPDAWTDEMSQGRLVAARYLAECTDPDDRVLMATYAPEVPVFARRLFAAGQGTFGLAFYESEAQQREAVARLQRQSVPVVLGSHDDFEGEFVADYRYVHDYVAARYVEAGVLTSGGEPRFRVFLAADRQPRRTHPVFGLPCFR